MALTHLILAYEALLQIPPTDSFRHNNQNIYATLRDYIADESNYGAEQVQNAFTIVGAIKGK